MSVEITKHVRISTSSLPEPLEMTTDAAIELRDALILAFPLPPSTAPVRSPPEKWVLTRKTWRKGSRIVSEKAVKKILNHVGEEWKPIGDICHIVGYSATTVRDVISVLEQERKMNIRGRGKTLSARVKTIKYTRSPEEVPKIEVVDKEHDFTVLQKEQRQKRDQMREK